MSQLHNDKTEAALSIVAYRYVQKEAQEFMNQDVSKVADNPEFKKRILKLTKNKHGRKGAIKLALIACLVILSVLFTAYICIPEIGNAMWKAFVEWYDDHISVSFTQPSNTTETSEESFTEDTLNSSAPDTSFPTSIQQKAIATYLPDGYYAQENINSVSFVDTFYYNSDGTMMFRLIQTIIDEEDGEIKVDNESDPVSRLLINQREAVLTEYSDSPGYYSLVWNDGRYAYAIYGSFASIHELVKIAEGIVSE